MASIIDISERAALVEQVRSQTDVDEDFILVSVNRRTGNVRITNTAFSSFEYMVGLLQCAALQFTVMTQGGKK